MGWIIATLVLVIAPAIALGLSPVLLPAKVSTSWRWSLAVLILAASLAIEWALSGIPHPFHHIVLLPLWAAQAATVPVLAFRPFRD